MTGTEYDFGPLDVASLRTFGDTFVRHEPLAESAALDSSVNPRSLTISLSEGFETAGRFDVRWSRDGYYSVHYTEAGLDFRYDYHPNPHSPAKHFHPPPDPSTEGAVPSCIDVELAEVVAIAVSRLWRTALEADDLERLNRADDPP